MPLLTVKSHCNALIGGRGYAVSNKSEYIIKIQNNRFSMWSVAYKLSGIEI